MSWALRRRILILSVFALVLGGVLVALFFPLLYQAPSCTDGMQNTDETGIDCGGSMCAYLCTAQVREPAVRFARPFSPSAGRTDVIAYVDNPNAQAAAKNAGYAIEVYSPNGSLLAKKDGVTDLPPGASVPIFLPQAYVGAAEVARVFVTFDDVSLRWYRAEDTRIVPTYNYDAQVIGDENAPRITATLTNPSALTLRNVKAVVTVFDAAGNAIAASQTVAPVINPQGVGGVIFTWNQAFSAPPARIDVVPVVPMPEMHE